MILATPHRDAEENGMSSSVLKATAAGILAAGIALVTARAADSPAPGNQAAISAIDLVNKTPKGKLHNPYKDSQKAVVAQGQTLFRSYPCSGCHGGDGGGGMCPPLTTSDWIYRGDDDTLFRLVTLGSDQLQKDGYTRQGLAAPVGPMPPMGSLIKDSNDLWKIIAFIRSRYDGDPEYKYGTPASPQ
jgi:mono/diheme cytochrome c family protein